MIEKYDFKAALDELDDLIGCKVYEHASEELRDCHEAIQAALRIAERVQGRDISPLVCDCDTATWRLAEIMILEKELEIKTQALSEIIENFPTYLSDGYYQSLSVTGFGEAREEMTSEDVIDWMYDICEKALKDSGEIYK